MFPVLQGHQRRDNLAYKTTVKYPKDKFVIVIYGHSLLAIIHMKHGPKVKLGKFGVVGSHIWSLFAICAYVPYSP